MGNGYTYFCEKCNFKIFLRSGIGLNYWRVSKELREHYLESNEIPELKRILEKYPEGFISGSLVNFQCPKCKSFHTLQDLSFYIEKEDPSAKDWFDRTTRVTMWRYRPCCPDCNVEMSRVLMCPKCLLRLKPDIDGKRGGTVMFWD